MADDDRHEPEPEPEEPRRSLELPSLRSAFRRGRRERAARGTSLVPGTLTERPAEPEAPAVPEVSQSTESTGSPESTEAEPPPAEPRRRSERKPIRIHLPGPVAALLAGVVVGLVLVGLTSASLGLCTSMRGTSSCGKPGILLLLVITLVAIFLGSLLLRLLGVAPHGSTSFLGVGLLVVLILLVLLPTLDEWWVVIVVPTLAMLTYLASWWLTTTYVEPGERAR